MDLVLSILVLFVLLFAFTLRGGPRALRWRLSSPVFVVAMFVAFYGVVATWYRELSGDFSYVGRDFSDVSYLGTLSTLVFLCFYCFGYFLTRQKVTVADYAYHADVRHDRATERRLVVVGGALQALGYASLGAWILVGGKSLAFVSSGLGGIGGASAASGFNFLLVFFDLAIPGITLFFLSKSRLRWWFLILFVAVSVALGFRYRIAVVTLALFSLYLLSAERGAPWKLKAMSLGVSVVCLFVLVGAARVYSQGLNLEKLANVRSADEVLARLFSDTNIMLGLSAVIQYVSENSAYLFFSPYLYAMVMFVPRVIWPSKPDPENFEIVIAAIGTVEAYSAGTAIPIWGEFFIAFGWVGVVLGALAFGTVTRRMVWLLRGKDGGQYNPYAAPLYSVLYGFIYLALSRGYVAQLLPELLVIVGPLWVLHRRYRRATPAIRWRRMT